MNNDITTPAYNLENESEEDIALICEILDRFLKLSPEERIEALEELRRLSEE